MANPGGSSCRLRHHCARIATGSRFGKEDQRRASGSPAFSTRGYLRWGNAHRGGQDRRCRTSDHPGLGVALQRPRSRRSPGWQVDRTAVQAQRHSAAGHRRHDREWPDPGGAWRGALAADRSGAMDLRGNSASLSPSRRSAGSCEPWATANYRPDRDTIEIWFADEARIGQKNKITRRWAKRGTRPSAPRDQRIASTYIFGAVCPKEGKGAALIMPACNTEAMNLHLAEIAATVAPAAHAILLVDQAGWHLSTRLLVPANITIIVLPPKCPELNPVENVWQFMRDNWLSNRIFKSYDDLVDHCCAAWNKLVDQPWRIMSIGLRQWAHGF